MLFKRLFKFSLYLIFTLHVCKFALLKCLPVKFWCHSRKQFFFLLGRDVTLKYITNKHLSKLYYLRLYSRHWLLLSDFLCEGALHTELLPR